MNATLFELRASFNHPECTTLTLLENNEQQTYAYGYNLDNITIIVKASSVNIQPKEDGYLALTFKP